MSNEAINQHLTEAMGECWHEITSSYFSESFYDIRCACGYRCSKGRSYSEQEHIRTFTVEHIDTRQSDFFTWQGFGKLWEWATKQEWWGSVMLTIVYEVKFLYTGKVLLIALNATAQELSQGILH